MTKGLQPILGVAVGSSDAEIEVGLRNLRYPLLASPKIDGMRLRIDPILGAVSRTHKPIPNTHTQEVIKRFMELLKYLDGEVIVGDDPTIPFLCHKTQSAMMTQEGKPYFTYLVFDRWFNNEAAFMHRHTEAKVQVKSLQGIESGGMATLPFGIDIVPQKWVSNYDDVIAFEENCLKRGFEGIMLRDANFPYKNGRSTLKQQGLLKLKRTLDDEAIITGFEALERNLNEQTRDAFGYAKRSSHKAGKVAVDLVGNIIANHPTYGQLSIGSGLDYATRKEMWQNQQDYIGKTVMYKYTPIGMKDKPRWPIYKGIRKDLA